MTAVVDPALTTGVNCDPCTMVIGACPATAAVETVAVTICVTVVAT